MYVILYRDGPRGAWRTLESRPPIRRRDVQEQWCRDHSVKGRSYAVAYIGDIDDWHHVTP